jgi:predicted dehydrogenase
MRIGILGSGFMGTTHARAYAKIPGVSIAAVSSRNLDKAEKLAREIGAFDHRRRVADIMNGHKPDLNMEGLKLSDL